MKAKVVYLSLALLALSLPYTPPTAAQSEECPCCYVPEAVNNPDLARYENPGTAPNTPTGEKTVPKLSIGYVDFGVTGKAAIRDEFDLGLGMLHHMMYRQARSTFESIAEDDPNCAMAYWGIATSLFQPLWPGRPSAEDLKRGWELTHHAHQLAQTDRERLLIEATAAFFRDWDTADYWTRIARWAEGLEQAYEAHPDDLDIASLYGLSRVALAQVVRNRGPLLDEAERVLRKVFETAPRHPGGIHYTIHATDVDGRADNALDMVRAYGEIAPNVPHALHMPTHLYVRLGHWPEVISWNARSAKSALDYPVGDRVSLHHIHALDYKLYGYLQQANDERAYEVLREALTTAPYQDDFIVAFHKAIMPARYAVERRDWESAASIKPDRPEYLSWERYGWPQAISWFARGMGAVNTGDMDAAREAEEQMITLRDAAREAGEQAFETYIEVDRLILSGWLAWADGNHDKAVNHIRESAALEPTVEKHPVTPGALYPPLEALGDLLMALDRPDEALEAYEAADAIWPGRRNTLLGATRAARVQGEQNQAHAFYERLLQSAGMDDHPLIVEARHLISMAAEPE